MNMGRIPLYPSVGGSCRSENCIRVPLFQNEMHHAHQHSCAQTVRLENPCCPGECAEVTLSVDCCGNLTVCVHREQSGCGCMPHPRKRCW